MISAKLPNFAKCVQINVVVLLCVCVCFMDEGKRFKHKSMCQLSSCFMNIHLLAYTYKLLNLDSECHIHFNKYYLKKGYPTRVLVLSV